LSAISKPRSALRISTLRALTFAIGCLGLAWGISNFTIGAAADDYWIIENHLLQFETFSRATATRMLEAAAAKDLSACETHSQRALLLLELIVADAALRSGAVREYDQHIQALEARTRRILSCTPRESFVWLIAFSLEIEHGNLDEHSFDLLATSYETSPNEAWVAVRRIIIAAPVLRAAPETLREMILTEFQNLVRHGFVEIPARAYLKASAPTRALLQSRIDQLDPRSQKFFSETLEKQRS
jgi:hypothetical protein